jgi:2Fe-2S ferredoxin
MPKVTFIEHDETTHQIIVEDGQSVMQGAIANNIPGIDADCGGQCACATCVVHVESDWIEKIGPQSSREAQMLSFADASRSSSRLACQIKVTNELDGLVVRMPAGQH